MRDRLDQQPRYYFSDRLNRQLARIPQYPLTVVEAPSGFGKTTAIREYLKENLPPEACEYWYTCLGESASTAWMGICELFSNVNDQVAEDLRKLKMPTMDTLFYMASYLRNIRCHTETYIVIDNYQRVDCDIPRELINVFSVHGNPNLHIIFITQQLDACQQRSICNDNVHVIGASAFFFDREGISTLFRMKGLRLTEDELEKIFLSTEGWVAAIRLQMISLFETGSLTLAADIEQLVENAIWNHLDPTEKDFLLSVSVLDNFTTRQATIMLGQDALPDKIHELLRTNDFIRYLADKRVYSIHSILLDYLRNRFYHQTSEDYQHRSYQKAGEACAASLQYCPAAEFYYKVKNFDAILSLPFTLEYLSAQKEKYQSGFCTALVGESPDNVLCRHPFTMIIFGYMALMNGHYEEYQKLRGLLCRVIQSGAGYSPEQLKKISGEYALLEMLGAFNDIAKMQENQNRYWALLGVATSTIKASTPWLFGSVSVLDMLWRESGELENSLRQIEQGRLLYLQLARGHGAGAFYTMRAEAMLMRGEDDEAEILCHKALHDARSYQQTDVCICTELTLARIAILRGDAEAYFGAVKRLQHYPTEDSSLYILRMVEHCMSIISLLLDMKDYVSPWFYDMENIKKAVYAPVLPHAQLLHLKLLLTEKRYNEFYGVCQHAMNMSRNPAGNAKYVMPQVYQLIFLAIAKRNNGRNIEAREHLKEALNIALPDQIYLPFAQQACMADFLPELSMCFSGGADLRDTAAERAEDSALPPQGASQTVMSEAGRFAALIALCRRQKNGADAIRKAVLQDKSPLTPREREIALLAKARLSAKEIAQKLYISEMTVRATLRNVYSKLGVHSRIELSFKEF